MLQEENARVIAYQPWPVFDPALLIEESVELPVQVNGKLRDRLKVSRDADRQSIEKLVLASEKIQAKIEGKSIKKLIVVPGKLVNIVVK